MSKHVVATVAEIPPGNRKLVTVRGRSIAVFNLGGEFFGLFNRCPHQGGPMCEGILTGLIESDEPGHYRYSRKGEILRCPWHGWEFDVRTGQSVLRARADPGALVSRGGRRRAASGAGTLHRRNRAGDNRGTLRRGRRLTACPVCKPGDPAPHPAHEPARTAHPACGPAVVRGSCRGAATLRSEPAGPGRPGAHRGVLDTLRTLKAHFLQVAPNGSISQGTAWLDRPGRMRFQYDPPSPLLLVAGHGLVVFQDKALNQTSNIPVGQTPLGILLADHVKLQGDVTVTAMQRLPGQIQVSLIRTASPGDGTLTLIFADNPLTLRQWTVLDAQRQETRVTLYNVETGGKFDQKLFELVDPRFFQPNQR